ncbi:hypothetical protein TVAGG3_0076660 [Trichomonas vaginalis G3]|uniref:hypothetical protein n=1 Tax=Trichomonas vaginalis (strain ATCC PRA-98 / G3) TaxID=412133 RepID=UPI0021E5596E|nr:hypothetical protein TVAGG3_0076660 [Trichomonas vaginalis G3]KAI5542917.1 hypothetical protein TVAGG3_0076660 [Trichomonas vaginalis G3]
MKVGPESYGNEGKNQSFGCELVSNAKGDAIESANKISEKVTKIADESDDIPTLEDTIKQLKELYEEQEKYTADFNPEL